MEVKDTKRHGDRTFKDNKNVNFVIVKNQRRPTAINIKNYIPLLKKHNLLESGDSNTNVNLIIIQNLIVEEDLQPGFKIKDVPVGSDEDCNVVKRLYNNNVNFIIIRNVIPLKKYCCDR